MMPRPAATGGLLPVRAQTAAVDGAHSAASSAAGDRDIPFYMEVFFAKQSKKKHKTWEDGILVFHSGSTELRREDGTCVTKSNKSCAQVKLPEEGSFLFMGSFELEVVKCITEEEYIQKGMDQLSSRGWDTSAATTQKPFQPISGNAPSALKKKPLWQKKKEAKLEQRAIEEEDAAAHTKLSAAPRAGGASLTSTRSANLSIDPARAGAHVLNDGCSDLVLVCVDPFIGLRLKPHQVEGVRFMFGNLTRDVPRAVQSPQARHGVQGCILADEMGLGKTIQAIALMWTVLKQSPVSSTQPLVKKCVVVCPSSLVFNWQNEIKKWLGDQRLQSVAVLKGGKGASDAVQEFVLGNVKPVLIISYDMLRRHSTTLGRCGECQLLVCDEAHRLKNINGNHTIDALNSLPAKRRVLLSGTPIQNDLQEFYAMINFVSPGLLGTPKQFQKIFADGIVKSRDNRCSEHDRRVGRKRLRQLSKLTSPLLLRRTMAHKVISDSMPAKTETLVFCTPSELQATLYKALLLSSETQKMIRDNKQGGAFAVIARIIKLLNHPSLLLRTDSAPLSLEDQDNGATDLTLPEAAATVAVDMEFVKRHFPADYQEHSLADSGKLQFVFALLRSIKGSTTERVVLVSNYTSTLDILEVFLGILRLKFVRLDGSVASDKRRDLVESFNRENSDIFVFLLSSLAGGVGLNLVGANRLVLIDPSWNPAHDLQAMARIWRFGQSKRCYIYRLITSGTMEEKILQKQLRKAEFESLVVDQGDENTTRNFTSGDLKNIFILENTCCETYDVLSGNAAGNVLVSKNASGRTELEKLHSEFVGGYRCTRPGQQGELSPGGLGGDAGKEDACLADSIQASAPVVSFLMWRKNTDHDSSDSQGVADGRDSDDSEEDRGDQAGLAAAGSFLGSDHIGQSSDDDFFVSTKTMNCSFEDGGAQKKESPSHDASNYKDSSADTKAKDTAADKRSKQAEEVPDCQSGPASSANKRKRLVCASSDSE